MENRTVGTPLKQPIVFELEGFDIPPGLGPSFFALALLAYAVMVLGNGVVVWVIIVERSLHRPMFVMVCHLAVCDLLGATVMMPCLMVHFLTGQRAVAYGTALTQALGVHLYGVVIQNILAVMAFDRYIAVCEPLRYHSIMTTSRLHCCCTLTWLVGFLFVFFLFTFHINVPLCGRLIKQVFCSNRSILRLACVYTPISDIYGLVTSWCLNMGVILVIAFSYVKILSACLKRGRSDSSVRRKAVQTCSTHLVVYVLYQAATVILIMLSRFPSVPRNVLKFLSIFFIVVPPAVNPFIYGLFGKELRSSIRKRFTVTIHPKRAQTPAML